MIRKINTEYTIVVMGDKLLHPEDYAEALEEKYGIRSLVVTDLPFAKQMTKLIKNAVDEMIFINITLPADKFADQLVEECNIPRVDAEDIADESIFMASIVDFENSTPDDLRVITYTGESDEITPDKFIDICAMIIEENSKSKEKKDESQRS